MVQNKRVLVIYTGGTFGMLKDGRGVLVPQKNIEQVIRKLPQLHDNEYWLKNLAGTEHKEYLALPDGKDTEQKILYKIYEYDELKDSSDFTMDDWVRQARDIKKFYHDYDGFVVLHGTDTTAYGASILSFMLESVGKTVVLTGAQVPIFQPRSDGNNNLLCAILIAATQHIPEVTVFFGARLFRGTRVKKVSNTKIYAFDSPNFPALLEAKTTLEVDPKMLIHPAGSVPDNCRLHDQVCRKVYILKVTPTITPELIRAVFSGMEGVVLETYGNGNIPIKRKEIYKEIETAVKNKVLVVNVTQCINGTVIAKPLYETGLLLLECGVVPAYDMTAEAAWAKLSYVLTKKELSYEEKVQLMKTNIRGEMLVKKVSNTKIYAFDSPNFPALLEAKTTLEVDPKMLIHPAGSVPDNCRLHDQVCRKVYILKVTPTITPELIRAVFSGMEGVVLETYGNGNIPIKRKEIYKEIETAVKNKVLVVNVTQCINGTVIAKPLYETGLLLLECGVVPAYDMTAEAAWAKLSYVLTKKELSYEEKVQLMKTNIRGEML